ncbi:hypothetical protein V1289_000466 [Bradyrhizobium sp. AZCC 2289]
MVDAILVGSLTDQETQGRLIQPVFIADVEYRDITFEGLHRACSFKGLSKGTGRTKRRLPWMIETLPRLVENSFQIAWDYLAATGELGNPDRAARHLLDTIEVMVGQGERRRLPIASCQQGYRFRPTF